MCRQFPCWGQCLAGHAASASPPRRGDVGAEDGRTARARGHGEARGHTTTRADVRSRSSSRGPRRSALFMPSPSVPTLGDARGHTLALRLGNRRSQRDGHDRAGCACKKRREHTKKSTHARTRPEEGGLASAVTAARRAVGRAVRPRAGARRPVMAGIWKGVGRARSNRERDEQRKRRECGRGRRRSDDRRPPHSLFFSVRPFCCSDTPATPPGPASPTPCPSFQACTPPPACPDPSKEREREARRPCAPLSPVTDFPPRWATGKGA